MNLLKAGKYEGSTVTSGVLLLSFLWNFERFGKESDKIYQAML